MKKLLALVLSLSMASSLLAGCAQSDTSTSTTDTETSESATSGEVITFNVGYASNTENSVTAAIRKWKELLQEKSGGTMDLELYLDGTLGSQTDVINSLQLGEPNIAIADGAVLAEYGAPDLGILYAPYLFDSWDQVWKLIESDWYQQQNDLLKENGLTILSSNWALGIRNLCLIDPVSSPADLAGRKIRVPNNQIQIEETNAIGAAATPLGMTDVYQSLQTGVIDGCENVNETLYSMQWCEVAKYVYEENHVYNMAIWITSNDVFNALTPEQQQWLVESADEAGLYNNQLQNESEEEVRQKMTDEFGVTFIECSDADKEQLVQMCESFYANGAKFGWSDGLYETVLAQIQ